MIGQRKSSLVRRRRRRLAMQALETRALLAAVTVDTTADDDSAATTSLRDAIELINATPVGEVNSISFAIPAAEQDPITGRFVIQPSTALPEIQREVTIDGSSQSNASDPPIQIDGSLLAGADDGLRIIADNVSIESVAVANFPSDGIETIGIDTASFQNIHSFGNGNNGVRLNDTRNATVEQSDIYANGTAGVQITGTAEFNQINFNRIGGFLDDELFFADGNGTFGVQVLAPGNTINGNTISGNGSTGIAISDPSAGGNYVIGNYIGTDPTGATPVPNGAFGVLLRSADNVVGDSSFGFLGQNIISGNSRSGLVISGAAAVGNQIENNLIGTDISGGLAIPNGAYGILVTGASENTIGGAGFADMNFVSGNALAGIAVSGGAFDNIVQGNYVGLKSNRVESLGNGSIGIYLRAGANNNEIVENYVAGNPGSQISLVAASTTGNTVSGNFIGFGAAFTEIPGGSVGVLVKSPGNTIGGNEFEDANYITGSNTGISLSGVASNNNEILGNVVGSDASINGDDYGMTNGIQIIQGATNNLLKKNTVAFNSSDAIRVSVTGGVNNEITENLIFGNGFGIDLGRNGFNTNDSTDADDGPNRLQNTLSDVSVAAEFFSQTLVESLIEYSIDTAPVSASYPLTVEFFLSDSVGQGLQLLSIDQFTAADFANGQRTHTAFLDLTALFFAPDFITATVTDADGNTSEFVPAIPLDIALPFNIPELPPAVEPASDPMDVNGDLQVSARDALVVINALDDHRAESESSLLNERRRGDVNGDGIVSARDALAIINRLAMDRATAIDAVFGDDDEADRLLSDEWEAKLF